MVRERWSHIRSAFFAALDVPKTERAVLVGKLCGSDSNLELEVLQLLAQDEAAGSFLEMPPVVCVVPPDLPPHVGRFVPGDRVAERFRILGLLGVGGMGEVYEAHDDIMHDVVAVKVVRPGLESLDTMAVRLRREGQLARRVTHSAVCRVHDVCVHDDQNGHRILLLVMERLYGETVAHLQESGSVARQDLLAIGEQIATGLDAAHAEGIVHRDVKPENIFLDRKPDGSRRAVLTDFGLAQATVTPDRITRSGLIAGTLGYLAPERIRGGEATAQSDLYSFAVVLLELFERTTPSMTSAEHAVLRRALDQDPGRRFGSGGQLIAALHGAARTHARTRRLVMAATAGLLALALFIAGFRIYQRSPSLAPSSEILLTDMINGTGQPDLEGAGEVLRSQLAQSPHFEVLDRPRIEELLARMRRPGASVTDPALAREVALRAGAPAVVYASLTRLAQEYRLSVKLELVGPNPALVRTAWTQTFTARGRQELFEAFHDAAVWIRTLSGELPRELAAQDRVPVDTTTTSWEALRLFSEANALSARGQVSDAVLVLEQAVRLDSEFAMGHMRLADVLLSLKREKQGYAEWQRAIELVDRHQLTNREALRIRGQFYEDTGDFKRAEESYRTYALYYPNDFHASFFLGSVLVERDRTDEAIGWFMKAVAQQPSSVAGLVHLALAQLDLRRTVEAQSTIARLDSLQEREWALWLRSLAIFADGDISRALSALDVLRKGADDDWLSRASIIRASWLAERGDDAGAIDELESGITFDEGRNLRDREADKWLQLADLYNRHEVSGQAIESVRRALETAPSDRRASLGGQILLRSGAAEKARHLLESFSDSPPWPRSISARARLQAEVELTNGDPRKAVATFRRSLGLARLRESRLPFAQALVRAGDRAEAVRVLTQAAAHPIRIYMGPEPETAGLWRQYQTLLHELTATTADRPQHNGDLYVR